MTHSDRGFGPRDVVRAVGAGRPAAVTHGTFGALGGAGVLAVLLGVLVGMTTPSGALAGGAPGADPLDGRVRAALAERGVPEDVLRRAAPRLVLDRRGDAVAGRLVWRAADGSARSTGEAEAMVFDQPDAARAEAAAIDVLIDGLAAVVASDISK